MSNELDLAAQYRQHAKNLLAAAQFDDIESTRVLLVKKANDFERMADALEGVDKTNKTVQRQKREPDAAASAP